MTRKLYTFLQIIFNDIREVMASPVYRRMCELNFAIKDIALVPPSYYDAIDGAGEVSKSILDLARRTVAMLQASVNFRG